MNQPIIDETGVNRVIFAEEPQPQPRPSTVKRVASRLSIEQREQHDAELTAAGNTGMLSAKAAVADVDQICLDNMVASADMHKNVLPEMLRVQEWFER